MTTSSPDVSSLRSYTPAFRRVEVAAIVAFTVLVGLLAWRLWAHAAAHPVRLLCALFAAYVAADLVSGLVHWLGDTWGTTRVPILGNALIRPFREHHFDEKAITRHDFVETNGANCLIALPGAVVALLVPLDLGPLEAERHFTAQFLTALIVWVMATNQIHKWAHADDPPAFAALLQRLGLILSPAHHAVHHTAPFASHYCITSGWLNRPLASIRFFRRLERLITTVTGAVPRNDGAAIYAVSVGSAAVQPADERRHGS